MTKFILHPYQTEAVDAVNDAIRAGVTRPAVVLPTGMGKTVIFSDAAQRWAAEGLRTAVLVHRDELVRQTVNKLRGMGLDTGIIQGDTHTLGRNATVISVLTGARRDITASMFDRVVVDECHHAVATSYLSILDRAGCMTGDVPAIGFTATMSRADGHLGDVWQDIVYRKDILWGIQNGFLVDVRARGVTVDGLDLATVARSRGDYTDQGLGHALIASDAPAVTVEAYQRECVQNDGTLRSGILFAPDIASANAFCDAFNMAGVKTELVIGSTDTESRQAIYERVRTGVTTVIASVMVLTEGFDLPELSCAVIARPTTRQGLYVQMVGRVLRTAPWCGKSDALVLDITDASEHHGLASIATLTSSPLPGEDDDTVIPLPGESLLEAAERTAMEHQRVDRTKVSATSVDLFAARKSAWLQTYGGTWFIPTRDGYIFLNPGDTPGDYHVGKTFSPYKRRGAPSSRYTANSDAPVTGQVWGWLKLALPLDWAMNFGEVYATELDSSVASRRSSMRRRASQAAPTLAQINTLQQNCLPVPATKQEAGDALSIHFASKVLDR